jgi:hypothetical protein
MSPLALFDRRNRQGERGAVYVELIIAFLPVFTFFLAMLQLGLLYASGLFVEHGATVAARVAALALGDPQPGENTGRHERAIPLGPQRTALVRKAALLSMSPLILDGTIDTVDVDVIPMNRPGGLPDPRQTFESMGDTTAPFVRVRVRAQVACKITIANHLLCPGPSLLWPKKWLSAESVFPVERASYEPDVACAKKP